MDEKEKAVMDAGVQYGMQMLMQLPKGDKLAMEAHITGVLIAFWGALWGTFGTEYTRGFIEAQLRGMEPDVPHDRFTESPGRTDDAQRLNSAAPKASAGMTGYAGDDNNGDDADEIQDQMVLPGGES